MRSFYHSQRRTREYRTRRGNRGHSIRMCPRIKVGALDIRLPSPPRPGTLTIAVLTKPRAQAPTPGVCAFLGIQTESAWIATALRSANDVSAAEPHRAVLYQTAHELQLFLSSADPCAPLLTRMLLPTLPTLGGLSSSAQPVDSQSPTSLDCHIRGLGSSYSAIPVASGIGWRDRKRGGYRMSQLLVHTGLLTAAYLIRGKCSWCRHHVAYATRRMVNHSSLEGYLARGYQMSDDAESSKQYMCEYTVLQLMTTCRFLSFHYFLHLLPWRPGRPKL
ncbi:hypothetical protein C8Q77DRAFT_446013 [Trametes polyzona]|nr:hypothetical protein C8Q77DRAFT_446013 [Trametes polyzona]